MKYIFVATLLCLNTITASAFELTPGEEIGFGGLVFNGFATQIRIPLGFTAERVNLSGLEGDLQQNESLFLLSPADRQFSIPSFIYTRDELNRDGMNVDTYNFRLTYFYARNKFNFNVSGLIRLSGYEKKNFFYFNKTRGDDCYGCALTVFYRQPFGCDAFNLWGNLSFYKSDADMDFLEQQAIEAAMGAMIRF